MHAIDTAQAGTITSKRPRIRRTWFAAVAMFLAIVLAIGCGALVLMRAQWAEFDRTSTQSELELGALSKLQSEILEAEMPIGGILYELDRDGKLNAQWERWGAHVVAIDEQFKRLGVVMLGRDGDALEATRLEWVKVVEGVDYARSLWGTGEVAEALAQGTDPFGPTVWASLSKTERELATVAVASVERLRGKSAAAAQRRSIAEAMLAVSLLAAVALAAWSFRRLSRRVIHPLLKLRATVGLLRDGEPGSFEVGPDAGMEVAELATAMSELAFTVNKSQVRLRDQANTDGLTGLANRRAFENVLDRATTFGPNYQTAVLMIDIDDFKCVNDSMGHAAGDELLVAIAGRMSAAARRHDTVARLGGDEFAIIIEGDDALGSATALARRLLLSMEQPITVQGQTVTASCSIGVADSNGLAAADDLVRRADGAMYAAKGRGKACLETFDPLLHAHMLSRSELRADLRRAAKDDQLVAHYQPVVDLETNEVIGLEALVRWQHPERGLLMPGDFIDLAEESGDIVSIGDWIIERACQDLADYQPKSSRGDALWMSVNLSPRQLLGGTLSATVGAALRRHGLRHSSLILEITEAALLTDSVLAAKVLDKLRAEGVRIAIDDFGTGFSSLQYLSRLPVDILKIDRSFVTQSGDHANADVILSSIVSMGNGLGLDIIAEGIELTSELAHLRALGPMAGQGYLLARPMAADKVPQHLHRVASGAVLQETSR